MKIPLCQDANHLYAISDQEIQSLKMDLQTPEFDPETMPGRGRMGGGFHGRGGMRGDGMRRDGFRRGMPPDQPEALKISLKGGFVE